MLLNALYFFRGVGWFACQSGERSYYLRKDESDNCLLLVGRFRKVILTKSLNYKINFNKFCESVVKKREKFQSEKFIAFRNFVNSAAPLAIGSISISKGKNKCLIFHKDRHEIKSLILQVLFVISARLPLNVSTLHLRWAFGTLVNIRNNC